MTPTAAPTRRLAELERYRRYLADTLAEWNVVGEAEGHVCGLIEGSHVEPPADSAPSRGPARRRK